MVDDNSSLDNQIKNINVSFDTWKRLTHIKADTGAACYDDVVVLTLDSYDKLNGAKNGNH